MARTLSKAISYVLLVVVIGCIGTLLFIAHQANKNPNKIPTYFGYKPLTVLTNSMQPRINAGDMVLVKEKEGSDVKKGDIITFRISDKKLITHRVYQVTKEGFVTKGDNNNVKDDWVIKPESLLGQVKFILPKAGLIAKFLASPFGFFLFIILPLLLLILIEVYQRTLSFFNKSGTNPVSRN
ncbi:signal peptidase I [Peribacillus kribbensis]|uniref:signal peptidase I n=1 Tax=Peribacillus kribbensis TaxID=356658 RepID=UPI0003FF10FD|nr:signal peptidase I [Peribacillus kribbensis]